MKYFKFRHSSESDIGRDYPQSQKAKLPEGKTVNDFDYIWNVHYCSIPNFTPFIGPIKLIRTAKLTDLISASYISSGFVISKKLEKVLKKNLLGKFVEIPVEVEKSFSKFDYTWIHFANDETRNIDFSKTNFVIRDSFGETEDANVSSVEDLIELCKMTSTLKKIKPINLTLLNEPNSDVFYFKGLLSELIISESIANEIIVGELTGIQLTEFEINKAYNTI